MVEPFTTGLFVRQRQASQWCGFWIGFEDSYHPKISLRRDGKQLIVFFDGENVGALAEAIDRMVTERSRTMEMGRNARALAEETGPSELYYRNVMGTYARATESHRKKSQT